MKPYSYYTALTVEFPNKSNYTLKYYYRRGKLLCIKKPFCDIEEVPLDAAEETVFDEEGYELHRKAWLAEKVKMEQEFKEDLIRSVGLTGSDKVEKCFSLAWDYGISSGLKEVHEYFLDLVDLIR